MEVLVAEVMGSEAMEAVVKEAAAAEATVVQEEELVLRPFEPHNLRSLCPASKGMNSKLTLDTPRLRHRTGRPASVGETNGTVSDKSPTFLCARMGAHDVIESRATSYETVRARAYLRVQRCLRAGVVAHVDVLLPGYWLWGGRGRGIEKEQGTIFGQKIAWVEWRPRRW